MPSDAEPLDDPARLRALRAADLLDTPPEERFDRLTRLAARFLNAQAALVSLVDEDRQFFKSCLGLPEPWAGARETPLSHSFCQHVVRSAEPLIIEDAREHPLVRDNLAIPDLGVIAYAGIPLVTSDGYVLGSFCAIDAQPRKWTEEEIQILRDLAGAVITEIELRRELVEGEHRYQRIVESIRDYGITKLGPDGRIRAWNTGAEKITGYTREEALGQHFSFIYSQEDIEQEEPERELADARESGRAEREGWRVRRDGSLYWEHQVVTPIWERNGKLRGFVKIANDLTKQRQAEERERELIREQAARAEAEAAERKIALILESITDAFLALDHEWRLTYLNKKGEELFGASREELLGRNILEIYPHLQDSPVYAACRRVLVEQTSADLEWPSRLSPGAWLHFHIARIAGGVAIYARDITERKRAEEMLEKMRAAMEASIDGIGIVSEDGVFSYVNQAQAELYGYDSPQDLIGKDWSILVGQDEMQRLQEEAMPVFAREGRWRGEATGLRRDGSTFPLDVSMTRIDHVGFVCVDRDITEGKEAERRIHQGREEAEAANRAKSEFLSRMSHELRTPLNAILGFGQLLELEVEREENQESVEQILKAGRHLLALIDEVLDIARIEAGRMSLSVEPVSVRQVLQESLDLVRHTAAQNGIRLRTQDVLASEQFVQADQQRLKQVLLNLLSNAIKYNRREGTVTLSCREIEEGWLRMAAEDTGFGIPPEKRERLFIPFERLDAGQTSVEGTGLGLALSKGLVEAMGGRLGVESVEGEGSTFWVDLPLASRLEEMPGEPVPGSTHTEIREEATEPTHTVLFVEDNLANVRLIERLFERRPHVRLLTAMQGSLGLELAREHRPDLILLDLNLPDISGDKVLLQLQQDPVLREIPVVMISGDAIPSQIQRMLSRGATAYLTKPLELQEVLRVVDDSLKRDEH